MTRLTLFVIMLLVGLGFSPEGFGGAGLGQREGHHNGLAGYDRIQGGS